MTHGKSPLLLVAPCVGLATLGSRLTTFLRCSYGRFASGNLSACGAQLQRVRIRRAPHRGSLAAGSPHARRQRRAPHCMQCEQPVSSASAKGRTELPCVAFTAVPGMKPRVAVRRGVAAWTPPQHFCRNSPIQSKRASCTRSGATSTAARICGLRRNSSFACTWFTGARGPGIVSA
jgi:hypothetical protein